jgi:hypothetical protein
MVISKIPKFSNVPNSLVYGQILNVSHEKAPNPKFDLASATVIAHAQHKYWKIVMNPENSAYPSYLQG